jgi:hypothetical protein
MSKWLEICIVDYCDDILAAIIFCRIYGALLVYVH